MSDRVEIVNGDSLLVLQLLDDNSVDAIVTDPPYGLAFMGKKWDYDVPSEELWRQCFRVLKAGGHMLCFAGTRTQHRMAVRIEDAGFEIRDMIAWVYGSGFPKSLDVSKAIDKKRDDKEDIHSVVRWLENKRQNAGISRQQIEQHFGTQNIGQGLFTITDGSTSRVATWEQWQQLKLLLNFDDTMDAEVWRLNGRKGKPNETWHQREVVGQHQTDMGGLGGERLGQKGGDITIAATPEAKQWEGWGTALKPALEPITVARKPLIGTVAENVLQHGTGAINVDGCRVGERWPANFIHDGSEEVTDLLGSAARFFYCAKASKRDRDEGCEGMEERKAGAMSGIETREGKPTNHPMRTNFHPTVKPTDLMRYLCRLVTPPDGLVLDPFMG